MATKGAWLTRAGVDPPPTAGGSGTQADGDAMATAHTHSILAQPGGWRQRRRHLLSLHFSGTLFSCGLCGAAGFRWHAVQHHFNYAGGIAALHGFVAWFSSAGLRQSPSRLHPYSRCLPCLVVNIKKDIVMLCALWHYICIPVSELDTSTLQVSLYRSLSARSKLLPNHPKKNAINQTSTIYSIIKWYKIQWATTINDKLTGMLLPKSSKLFTICNFTTFFVNNSCKSSGPLI